MALSSRSRLLELLVIVHDGSVEGLGAFGGCVVRHVAAARLVLLLFITLLRVLGHTGGADDTCKQTSVRRLRIQHRAKIIIILNMLEAKTARHI